MSEPLPDAAQALVASLVQLPGAVKPYGLTQPQFALLAALYDGPLAVQELAKKLYGEATRPVTEMIHQVVGKGMAVQKRSERDTRVYHVTLTDHGAEVVRTILKVITT